MVETPEAGPAAPRKPARGQKLWAVLLVLDSFFVIIFGGALAAKLYQHWQAPPPALTRRPRPVKAPEASKPAESPKAPEPEKPAAAAKAEPVKAQPLNPNAPRPPKPSMLHEAQRHENAKLQGGAQQAAAAPAAIGGKSATAPGAVQKAVPVEFHYKGQAKHVELVGAFIVRGGKKAMVESAPNSWTLTLYLTPNTYRYHFFVNGKKVLDPDNSREERSMSVITVAPAAGQ